MLSETPLSAGLGRRLAEAADGFRDGLYHYFIASRSFPFFLITPPGSSSDVSAKDTALQELEQNRNQFPERDYEIFGPFFTPPDNELKDFDYIEIRMMKNTYAQGKEVVRSYELDADADAVFFTLSAVDKFLVPYYSLLYNGSVANEIRTTSMQKFMSAAPTIHKGGTIAIYADRSVSF